MPFQNVTGSAGINYRGQTWSASWADMNGDNLLDLWISKHNPHAYTVGAVDGSLYLNHRNGTFTDVTDSRVQHLIRDYHGSRWADFDNDGDPDLVIASSSKTGTPATLFENANGILSDVTQSVGIDYSSAFYIGRNPVWFDYNHNGRLDLLYSGQNGTELFRQTAGGDFVRSKTAVGLSPGFNTQKPLLSDLDGDGSLELLAGRDSTVAEIYDTSQPTWTNVRSAWVGGIQLPQFQDAVLADFNNDGRPDLFLTRGGLKDEVAQTGPQEIRSYFTGDQSAGQLGFTFKTQGNVTFVFPKPDGLVNLAQVHVGPSGRNPFSNARDFDFQLSADNPENQGLASLNRPGIYIGYNVADQEWNYVVVPRPGDPTGFPGRGVRVTATESVTDFHAQGIALDQPDAPDQLLINNGSRFVDRSVSSGVAAMKLYGSNCAAGDFDNDGDIDIYVDQATPALNRANRLLVNQGDGTFVLTVPAGAAGTSLGTGGAVAVADYNQDGFLDIVNLNGGSNPPFNALQDGPTQLLRNIPNGNHWIEVRLHGTDANADGLGAKVFVTAGGRQQFREAVGGQHAEAQDSPLVHFGLGGSTTISRLEVQWPNGTPRTVLNNLSADAIIDVRQAPSLSAAPGQTGLLDPADAPGLGDHPAWLDTMQTLLGLSHDGAAADAVAADLLLGLSQSLAADAVLETDAHSAAADGPFDVGAVGDETGYAGTASLIVADWLTG